MANTLLAGFVFRLLLLLCAAAADEDDDDASEWVVWLGIGTAIQSCQVRGWIGAGFEVLAVRDCESKCRWANINLK